MIKYFQTIFRGIGQVMFQNNIYSGILFLAGIFYNSWILGLAALSGAIISTATARILKYPEEDIQNGLYGFNGVLTGIALILFFKLNLIIIFAFIIATACSTLVMHILKKLFPPFTAPFVVVTWGFMVLLIFVFRLRLSMEPEAMTKSLSVLSAIANGFGQVMFQKNIITGIFFLLGIFINSRLCGLYALYASLLGFLIGWLFYVPLSDLNAGLMGYNGVLCAIALAGTKKSDFGWITLAVILSVLLNIGIAKTGVITLTAPFVLSTWIILIIKNGKRTSLRLSKT